MAKKINIAIDGHSSCGKSTLAKDLARSLNYIYIDSGAMYRVVALYMIRNNIDFSNDAELGSTLEKINIDINTNKDRFCIFLNGEDVTGEIISIKVSNIVSEVAAKSIVRRKLVKAQQALGADKGVVMDGRDIGTVVFPEAEVKLFLTAHPDIRTQRRFEELKRKDMPTPFEDVKRNLLHRDNIDGTREDSPLIQAQDAILIDNSYMDMEEQLFIARKIVEDKIR